MPRDATPEDALRIIYTAMLEIYSRAPARGCLVFSTAVAEAPTHPEICSRLAQRLVQTDTQFRRLFDHIAPDAPEGARQAAAEMAAAVLHPRTAGAAAQGQMTCMDLLQMRPVPSLPG